ncbi:MAG: TonB-dependent receptor [Pseudomonadales bacterium]|nr:TonB-dependent receptor [Pseudomonadales bacterium]
MGSYARGVLRVAAPWLCVVAFHVCAAETPQPGPGVIEEVIVTAERRESSLQKTPVAISVFNDEFLKASTVRSIQDVAPYSPGLNYTQVSNFAQLNMRGIGLEQINMGGEPGVAFHVDGVYVARPFVNDAVFLDLARVEVLRGPQGTLYGRNATGGSVNLISNTPTDTFESEFAGLVGNYDRVRISAMASGPLGRPGVRGRIAVVSDERDGYLDNLLNGKSLEDARTRSVRGQLDFDLSESLTLAVAGDYMKQDDTGPMFRPGDIPGTAAALGGRLSDDPWKIYVDGPSDQDVDASGLSARLNWDLEGFSVTAITAWRRSSFDLRSDLDGTDFFLVNEDLHEDASQFSQELQIASADDDRLQWLAGAYYFHENADLDYIFPIPPFATTIRFVSEQETTAYALFGQISYALTDRLTLTAGLRYSDDEKKGSTEQTFFVVGNVDVDDDWQAWTPRFVIDYQVSDASLVYLSVARGFKAGGINTGSLQVAAYDPEYVWNYEVGVKSRFFEDRLQTNLAAFQYNYDDLQVTQFAVGQTFIENAADAEGRGIELEATALIGAHMSLSVALAYLDAEFTRYQALDTFRPELGVLDLENNDLPRAPKFTASVVAQYDQPFASGAQLSTRIEYQYQDDFYFTSFNTDYAQGGQYDLLNARIAFVLPGQRWEVAAFGKNLTDQEYELATTVSGINAGTLELYGAPRTYGVEARYRFE